MGWWLTAADEPPVTITSNTSTSVTVALIVTLGPVLVALIVLAGQWLSRAGRIPTPPPDPKLGEKVAVLADHDETDRLTLAQLDRHVDGIGDQVDDVRRDQEDNRRDIDRILRHLGLQ